MVDMTPIKSVFKAFSRKGLERIKNVWGSERVWDGEEIQHWLQHPLVQERINVKISGPLQINRFQYFQIAGTQIDH